MITRRLLRWSSFAALLAGGGCTGTPMVPANPTWADVQPIIQGECSGCHGSTADVSGAGYRFDFYAMTTNMCGDAALAMRPSTIMAGTSTAAIRQDLTLVGGRSKMPPLPAAPLAGWERDTILRWTNQGILGPPPDGNRPPTIHVGDLPATVDKELAFTAIVGDPDGQETVGALEIAGVAFLMNRSGSFAVTLDATQWPAGTQHLVAELCDGWTKVTYDLGPIQIKH